MKQKFLSNPASSLDRINSFMVGDMVETTQGFKALSCQLNKAHKGLNYPEHLIGQIKDIVRLPTGSYHIIMDCWPLPIGVRYIQKTR